MPGKKVLEHCSDLHPSEKELLEQCSITKIPITTPTHTEMKCYAV
jgi:hypothetical protein